MTIDTEKPSSEAMVDRKAPLARTSIASHVAGMALPRDHNGQGGCMSEVPVQTSVDDVHAHAHKTGHSWVDLAVALSAIAISVISLFVAIGHGRTEEKLVAASSWPFLTFQTIKNGLQAGSRVIDLRVQNSGVGPARVQWVKMTLDGTPIRNRSELMSRCCDVSAGTAEEQVRLGLVTQNEPIGVLPAREGVDMLAWRELPGNAATWTRLDGIRHHLKTEACYCSVLDECWRSDLTATAQPHHVERCEPISDGYTG
jgi:hypothetical protein